MNDHERAERIRERESVAAARRAATWPEAMRRRVSWVAPDDRPDERPDDRDD